MFIKTLKVGDYLECVDPVIWSNHLTKGKKYQITSFSDICGEKFAMFKTDTGIDTGFWSWQFKKA